MRNFLWWVTIPDSLHARLQHVDDFLVRHIPSKPWWGDYDYLFKEPLVVWLAKGQVTGSQPSQNLFRFASGIKLCLPKWREITVLELRPWVKSDEFSRLRCFSHSSLLPENPRAYPS
ncbi:hypothetical protein D3C72_2000270 [compost metagenome]